MTNGEIERSALQAAAATMINRLSEIGWVISDSRNAENIAKAVIDAYLRARITANAVIENGEP